MTDPQTPGAGPAAKPPSADPRTQVEEIARYLEQHRGRFTDEALAAAARAQGYPETSIEAAFERVRALDAVGPSRDRTRSIVLGAYAAVFVLLSVGMFVNGNGGGIVILGGSLGLAAIVSGILLGGRRRTPPGNEIELAVLVLIPVLMLLGVSGLCLATGMPVMNYSLF